MMDREKELKLLVNSQYRDMKQGQRQWPEEIVDTSLDKPYGFGNGDVYTLGDFVDQDGEFYAGT